MSLLAPPPPGTLDFEAELAKQSPTVQEAARKVRELLANYDVEGELPLRPASLTYRSAEDKLNFKNWSGVIHALSPQEQQRMPALLRLLARAGWALGDFQAAQRDYHNLGETLKEPGAKAEAFHQAYLCALERPHLGDALYELKFTLEHETRKYAPLPLDQYDPDRLLNADGFGLLARCKLRGTDAAASVRTVATTELDQPPEALLEDLRKLQSLGHPSVIKLGSAAADPDDPQRLVLLVEYLEGQTLEQYLQRHGAMTFREALSVGTQIAQGLATSHAAGLTHRAVRPTAIQVARKKSGGFKATLLDFGLMYPRERLQEATNRAASLVRTMVGRGLVSAADFAAPEQLGKVAGDVGPASDVYSWAKCVCFALFNTPHPAWNHWQNMNDGLAALLHGCLREEPAARPTMAEVVIGLEALKPQAAPAAAPVVAEGKEPKLVTTVAPPPEVGQFFEPKRGAGIASRKRLTPVEQLRIRIQRLTLFYGLIGLGLIAVLGLVYVVFFYRPAKEVAVIAPVRGVVLCQGEPVPDARIAFIPEARDGEVARGTTNEKGEFILTTLLPNDGAFPGTYRVVIEKEGKNPKVPAMIPGPDPRNPMVGARPNPLVQLSQVHPNYSREQATPLRFTVPKQGDTNVTLQLNVFGLGAR